MKTDKNQPALDVSLDTVETIVQEVETEGISPYRAALDELRRQKRGTEAYQEALVELWTAADVLKIKAEAASEVIDEYEETLPE